MMFRKLPLVLLEIRQRQFCFFQLYDLTKILERIKEYCFYAVMLALRKN